MADFTKSYENYKDEYHKKSEEKQKELFLQWKKRKEQLPSFMSSFFDIIDMESKKNQEMSKESKENYSERIKEENKPKIDETLRKKRLDEIFKRENPKLAVFKENLLRRKKKQNISHSISATCPVLKKTKIISKSKDSSKSESSKKSINIKHLKNNFAEIKKSEVINQKLVHKPIKIQFVSHPQPPKTVSNTKKNIDSKKIDYLKQINNNKINEVNDNTSNTKSDQTEKRNENKKILKSNSTNSNNMIKKKNNTNNNNLMNNIELIKKKAEYIDKQADKNEKRLKINDFISNNPKLGQKVSNLLISSIQTKLSILNHINKQILLFLNFIYYIYFI